MAKIQLLRFADLKEAQVVTSWPQLKRLVDFHKFPEGFMLSPAVRVWDASEVQKWLDSRRHNSMPDLSEDDGAGSADTGETTLAEHEAREKELRDALMPFARMSSAFSPSASEDWIVFGTIRVRDLKNAHKACWGD